MDSSDHYRYTSLSDDSIRLIKFMRASDASTVADLRVFSSHKKLPPYCALSYAWISNESGVTEGNNVVEIDDRTLPILDSVHSFIQALRARGVLLDGTWWWIDSICIDQQNLEERSSQVGLMQQIYRRARKCIVWLGNESDDSDEAVSLVQALAAFNLHGQSESAIRVTLKSVFGKHEKQWKALKSWFERKWWTRIWTIQEFVIPRSVALWCGTQNVSRTVVCRALMVADKCTWSGFTKTPGFRYGFNRRRLWMLYNAGIRRSSRNVTFSLAALAAYFSISDATDDRDRLYGLRALSTDAALLDVSYDDSYEEVYLRYTQDFIRHHKSLDIICFASVHASNPPCTDHAMPSWVPDWRRHMSRLVLPLMVSQGSKSHIGNMRPPAYLETNSEPAVYSASGNRQASYILEDRVLIARGVMVDSIDGLAGSNVSPLVQSSGPKNLPTTDTSHYSGMPIKTLLSVCKALCLDRSNRYLQYGMPKETFFRDFIRLCHLRLIGSLDSEAEHFKKWFDRTRCLQIRGRTFEDTLRAGIAELGPEFMGESTPPPVQSDFIHNSFFGRFIDAVTRMSKRLMVSREGCIGLVPEQAKEGDCLCILYGCSVPVVLRRSEAPGENGFTVVGECFIDGLMEGKCSQLGCVDAEIMFRIT